MPNYSEQWLIFYKTNVILETCRLLTCKVSILKTGIPECYIVQQDKMEHDKCFETRTEYQYFVDLPVDNRLE